MDDRAENARKPASRVKNNIQNVSNLGKLPPQNIEIEQAVLGALMLEKNAVTDTIDMLKAESFYDPKHQLIYTAIDELFRNNDPIDILTVVNQLKKKSELEAAGGAAYISSLTNRVASSAHVEFHSRIIAEKHIKRELIHLSSEIAKNSYDESMDVFDVLNHAESNLFKISEHNLGKQIDDIRNVVKVAIEEIEKASQNKDGLSGVPSGFFDLDKITAGWQRSDMIVIAARPAMGKTAFVLSMARNTAVDYGMGVAVFSLEMSSVQLVKRLIASETQIPAEKLRKGNLREDEFQQLHSRISKLANAPIYIDDTPGISVFDLRAKCRRLKQQNNYKLDMIIIDYLQLMTAGNNKGGGNREQEISTISRSIKEIAKELNVPVIALSQLSRSVEQRGGDKRPVLSDLRESGAIEQDADIVSFIYRPEYYGFQTDEDGNSNQGIGEIIVAKHRNGALDTVRLRFVGEFARFENVGVNMELLSNNSGPAMGNLNAFASNFENQQTITIKSKMNENYSDETDFQEVDSDSPF